MKSNSLLPHAWAFLGTILLYTGCIAPKDSVTSRSMQNLTARYNIIYNANILLDESAANIEKGTLDNYGQLLSVYKEPSETVSGGETTNLDSVIKKANTIVNDKLHSNFVDDAYLLIAKADFLKANFFNAAEFFSYIDENYRQEKEIRQQSLAWKTRALLQLENYAEASNTIDTALKYIETSKKTIPEVYAAYAQFLISTKKETEAIPILEKAIDAGSSKHNEIRWKYVLAQLQEKHKQYEQAYNNYSAVVKSNASFEMAFNANLNRIRIEDQQNGKVVDRVARLKSLLKGDKNKDFTDQIYYQLGNIHFEKDEFDEAIENYNTSIRKSTVNQNQKGLSYLKLADIYFGNADYVRAKAYYDSTVTALSPKYPGYDLIRKKSSNLELLASRYSIIAREDTLQALARLPEAQREARIGELVRVQADRALAQVSQQPATNNLLAGIDNPASKLTEGKFYFNNSTAISQGLSDFKRRYGNRRLEDNWRRAAKTAAESTQSMSTDPDAPIGASLSAVNNLQNPEASKQDFLKNLPLTEPQLRQSNQKIAEAYYDIANFYKDELKDEPTAINTYEELLQHSPQSTYVLPTYYSLYLLHKESDVQKSNSYRDLILSKYPDSPFAKAIRDPNYSRETDEKEQALNNTYNTIFNLYTERKYAAVLPAIQKAAQQFSNNKLSPQLDYLNALALGHTQKMPAFETSLQQLVAAYPQDQLVTPLAKLHLQYIQDNRAQMLTRPTALLDYDASEPYFEEPVIQAPKPVQQVAQGTPATNSAVQPNPTSSAQQNTQNQQTPSVNTPEVAATATLTPAPKSNPVNSMFSLPGAAEYYFVVNVTDYRVNLSSSRFGIGQFNRSRYAGKALKHQLQDVGNENQLVYVGAFQNYEDVKAYESAIKPLLTDIMKIPAQQYNSFAITKESLEKLKTRQLVDTYIEFYKNSN